MYIILFPLCAFAKHDVERTYQRNVKKMTKHTNTYTHQQNMKRIFLFFIIRCTEPLLYVFIAIVMIISGSENVSRA